MSQCIVIVQFDLPSRTEGQSIEGALASAPTYRELGSKGLIRKDYLNGDSGTGGVYLWTDRQSAQAWFSEERLNWLAEKFGVKPTLTWYDSYVTVDNVRNETRVNGAAMPAETTRP